MFSPCNNSFDLFALGICVMQVIDANDIFGEFSSS